MNQDKKFILNDLLRRPQSGCQGVLWKNEKGVQVSTFDIL